MLQCNLERTRRSIARCGKPLLLHRFFSALSFSQVMLGGGHINADMQQFLEKDKKALTAAVESFWAPFF